MRLFKFTYYLIIVILVLLLLERCSAGEMREEGAADVNTVQAKEAEEESASSEQAASVETDVEYSKKDQENLLVKKWNDKAVQQLESIEDLLVLLDDSSLDKAFEDEIKKELNTLYPGGDSVLYQLLSDKLKFRKFEALNVESGDTLSLLFKNKKELMKAEFVVAQEEKTFGTSVELIDRLVLISIQTVSEK